MTLVIALLFPVFGFAQTASTATLYDLKSNQQKKLFTLNILITPENGDYRTEAKFVNPSGEVALVEKGLVRDAQLLTYEIDQKQTQEKGRMRVEAGRIYFEYEGPGGKKKKADEKVSGFILGTSNFNGFIWKNWDELTRGKALDVRFAVWDRLETVGFTVQKIGEMEKAGERWMELRMKPTSFLIAALVDPIHFWYSLSDKQLRVMKGRVAPKQFRDGKWRDLDAEAIYTYDQKSVSN